MAILGLNFSRRKDQDAAQQALEAATRERLAGRLQSVNQKRRLREFGAVRGVNRQFEREPAYRVATIMFAPDETLSCRIVDQSHSGLRLSLNSDVECPEEFALTIPTLRFIGIVKKVWQNGREAGVSIIRWNDAD